MVVWWNCADGVSPNVHSDWFRLVIFIGASVMGVGVLVLTKFRQNLYLWLVRFLTAIVCDLLFLPKNTLIEIAMRSFAPLLKEFTNDGDVMVVLLIP